MQPLEPSANGVDHNGGGGGTGTACAPAPGGGGFNTSIPAAYFPQPLPVTKHTQYNWVTCQHVPVADPLVAPCNGAAADNGSGPSADVAMATSATSAVTTAFKDIQFDSTALDALLQQHGVQQEGAAALKSFFTNQMELANCRLAPSIAEDEAEAKKPRTDGAA